MVALTARAWRSAAAPRRPSLQCDMLASGWLSCCTTCVLGITPSSWHLMAYTAAATKRDGRRGERGREEQGEGLNTGKKREWGTARGGRW